MKILVVGGAGYIGAHTVLELLDCNHSVVVFDDFSTGKILNIDKRAKIFKGDILSKNDLHRVFKENEFDAVMHFSALKAPSESMSAPHIYSETNIVGSINVLNQMIKSKVFKFIFSSSSSVYGEPIKPFIDEDHPLNPISYYGFTKLQVEKILIWYSKITKLNFVSLRYFNAAGYDLKCRIKIPEKNTTNLIPRIMNVIFKEKKTFRIFGSDYDTKDGTCIRDYIHVSDLARAHVKSLNYLDNNNEPLFYNLATGHGHTVLDIITEIEKQLGCKLNLEYTARRKGDPSVVVSRSKHKSNIIGWEPKYSDLKIIIASVLNIYNLEKSH